ncbi:MAG: PBP1A family penicillin-binding protein [Deltaproteobacteria bacterium]|nr:PBP1A family penicillin-binding protein [Deltaproteobacteria bacterium]MCL5276532.1 PBP1A family penicillin-binding protein [Deltaproteobacteria bacterium]
MTEDTNNNGKQQEQVRNSTRQPHRGIRLVWLGMGVMALGIVVAVGAYFYIISDIPQINTITDYKPSVVTNVYGDDGSIIGQFFIQRRVPVSIDQMSKYVPQAFIAAEDATFYQHGGVDYEAIFRAAIKDLLAGQIVQGGSTITQQLVKTLLLTPQKTVGRKLKEFVLATRLERHLTKKEILNIYLNQIYLGNGCYGVECASEMYFGKKAKDLTLAEAAILGGLPRAPNLYSPVNSPQKAKMRQKYVLGRMAEQGYITRTQAELAYNQPVKVYLDSPYQVRNVAPYFLEMLKQQLYTRYGQDTVLEQGLKVFTTIDPTMQRYAGKALRAGIERIAKKQGYTGPEAYLKDSRDIQDYEDQVQKNELAVHPEYYVLTSAMSGSGAVPVQYAILPGKLYRAVVTGFLPSDRGVTIDIGGERGIITTADMSWAHPFDPSRWYPPVTDPHEVLKAGDVVLVRLVKKGRGISEFSLEPHPNLQGALVALDVRTGGVRALVGGYDFGQSQYNHAVQAQRQAGSSFKPIYYTAALEKGYTPASIILDTPVVYQYTDTTTGMTETGTAPTVPTVWKPRNYDKTFTGPVTLEDAITHSKNNPSIRLLNAIGIRYATSFARKFGITEPLTHDLTLALGSSSISLIDLVSAYNVFPNYGTWVPSYYIRKVVDRSGVVLEDDTVVPHAIDLGISPTTFTGPGMTTAALRQTAGTSPTVSAVHVVDPATAYVMISMLRNVVKHGTGWRAGALGRPAAGKTGTTEDNRDAWFIGFTPDLTAGVWVGFDDNRSLGIGEVGGNAAAPIWLDFMKNAVAPYPDSDFPIPPNIVFARIDPKTGYLATANTPDAKFEAFVAGTQPTQTATQVNAQHGNEFFRFEQ